MKKYIFSVLAVLAFSVAQAQVPTVHQPALEQAVNKLANSVQVMELKQDEFDKSLQRYQYHIDQHCYAEFSECLGLFNEMNEQKGLLVLELEKIKDEQKKVSNLQNSETDVATQQLITWLIKRITGIKEHQRKEFHALCMPVSRPGIPYLVYPAGCS